MKRKLKPYLVFLGKSSCKFKYFELNLIPKGNIMTKRNAKKKLIQLRKAFDSLAGGYRGDAAVSLAMDIASIVEKHPKLMNYGLSV